MSAARKLCHHIQVILKKESVSVILPTIQINFPTECPEAAPVMAIAGGIVAAVILIPLLLIILFIFLRNRRDAKEFADFMKEREKAKWDSVSVFL